MNPKVLESAEVSTKGGFTSVKIPQSLLERHIALCSNSLIRRLILQKGDSPYKLPQLKETLTTIWGIKEQWRLTSLGKGYYHIFLDSQEMKQRIWNKGPVDLKPWLMRLQA